MLFIYTLLFLVVVVAAIFSTPLRAKAWTALALTAAGALWASVRASAYWPTEAPNRCG